MDAKWIVLHFMPTFDPWLMDFKSEIKYSMFFVVFKMICFNMRFLSVEKFLQNVLIQQIKLFG